MSSNDAESQAQSARRSKVRVSLCPSNSDSEGGAGGTSGGAGDISSGTDRAAGAQAIVKITARVTGKILTRLVDRAQQRLNEAEECLIWYERQKQQATAELTELQQMIAELSDISDSE